MVSDSRSGMPHIIEVAERAWSRALADLYSPPVPDPVIDIDDERPSHFYIDTETWTVHLNLASVPDYLTSEETFAFVRSVCHHELQHYLTCPYDNVTSAMMFSRARRHLNDETAMFACNLFADLVVDSLLLEQYPRLTHNRIVHSVYYSAMKGAQRSVLWSLIVATYRVQWGLPVPESVKLGRDILAAASEIVEVFRQYRHRERRWPLAVEKIAQIIARLGGTSGEEGLPGSGSGESIKMVRLPWRGEGKEDVVRVPQDVDRVMGSPVEIRNGERVRECTDPLRRASEAEIEATAASIRERGGNLEDFRAAMVLRGVTGSGRDWLRFWYRALARELVRLEIRERSHTGALPLAPIVWRIGDPIEELDVVQSLQAFPVLIPNLSTRRWHRVESYSDTEAKVLPDLLLVLDSSGSMTWNVRTSSLSGAFHLALLSAFAAIDYVLRRGSRVAVINFSSDWIETRWTRERSLLERVLLRYQGEGTVLPAEAIETMGLLSEHRTVVLMVTDAEVSNWGEMVRCVRRLTQRGHSLFVFHIWLDEGSDPPSMALLTKAGATVIRVSRARDLVGLVLNTVRAVF